MQVDPWERDDWANRVLGFGELPDDGCDLPPGCVPYLPSSVEIILRTVERAAVTPRDVFVDVGSGLGRAMMLVHLLTGAGAMGLEVQAGLAAQAARLAEAHRLDRVRTIHGDAENLIGFMTVGTVFFLYCPFGGDRLVHVMREIRALALVRPLRLCFVDMPVPELPWFVEDPSPRDEAIAICRTVIHPRFGARAEALHV